jgi:hypothetical protein
MRNTQSNDAHDKNQEYMDPETGEFVSAEQSGLNIDEAIYIKTITPARINALPERAKVAGKTVLLYTCSGIVTGTEMQSDASNQQEFEALVGQFEAVVYLDPEGKEGKTQKYRSGYCYLPGGFHERLLSAYKRALGRARTERGEDIEGIQHAFIFDIAAVPTGNPRGYSYMAANAMAINPQFDPLSQLNRQHALASASGKLPLLTDHSRAL